MVRAIVLLQLGRGDSATHVAEVVRLTPFAVRTIAQRYRTGGMARAVFEAPRPGAAEVLAPSDKQRIIAMVCSAPRQPPPAGRCAWSPSRR